ncbi:MAG: phage integrase SAM-like domain-containing protein, partial [Planctomycetaceae bacterium]|nr:phage integrase SAM-like domain-containing protein [Planctomycetaceae bacterium]
MSSLYKENSGWRLQFDLGEKRYKIRLGKLPQKNAETIQSRVNELVNAKDGNYSYSQESARWLSGIGDDLHEKLASVGLIAPRQSRNLAAFLEAYKSERTDWKPSTLGAFNTAAKHLLEFFGEIRLRDVTPEKADAYRSHLIQEGYATAFVSKLITQARNYFNVAKRRKLVDENSFMEVKAGSQVNKNRDYIVSDDEAEALINACSNAEQRLIIALGFYAGLRIPSELGGLRLSEIIWDTNPDNGISRDRFIIHAPKTEKKGKPTRCCPIFPKLKPYFLDVIETMPEGQDLIFSGYAKRKSMGSFFDRLAKKAGITLWTKPAQNLRLTASNRVVREFGV